MRVNQVITKDLDDDDDDLGPEYKELNASFTRLEKAYRKAEENGDKRDQDLKAEIKAITSRMDEIEAKVSSLAVPLGYSEELYALRVHIELLRNKLRNAAQQGELSEFISTT